MLSLRQLIAGSADLTQITRINDAPWSKPKNGESITRINYPPYDTSIQTVPISTKEAHDICGHDYAIDFPMPIGTKLFATCSGRVIKLIDLNDDTHPAKSSLDQNTLNYMLIKDDLGQKYLYGHLKKNSSKVKEGDYVNAGQLIAESGHNGASTIPHLHFGLYKDDPSAVNIWCLQSIPIQIAWTID